MSEGREERPELSLEMGTTPFFSKELASTKGLPQP